MNRARRRRRRCRRSGRKATGGSMRWTPRRPADGVPLNSHCKRTRAVRLWRERGQGREREQQRPALDVRRRGAWRWTGSERREEGGHSWRARGLGWEYLDDEGENKVDEDCPSRAAGWGTDTPTRPRPPLPPAAIVPDPIGKRHASLRRSLASPVSLATLPAASSSASLLHPLTRRRSPRSLSLAASLPPSWRSHQRIRSRRMAFASLTR